GSRTVVHSPLDPYGAIRPATVPATRAPALARYLRCHRAARVLAPVWSADSLAVLPGFVIQQYPERPQRSNKPPDDEADESGGGRRFLRCLLVRAQSIRAPDAPRLASPHPHLGEKRWQGPCPYQQSVFDADRDGAIRRLRGRVPGCRQVDD